MYFLVVLITYSSYSSLNKRMTVNHPLDCYINGKIRENPSTRLLEILYANGAISGRLFLVQFSYQLLNKPDRIAHF